MTTNAIRPHRVARLALLAALSLVVAAAPALAGEEAPGKKLFVDQGCARCHSVAGQGIEHSVKVASMVGADLGKAAPTADREALKSFLKQSTTIDGEKHKAKFKGSDEELQAILDWLASLPGS
ncbi:MAG: cytochrome c [Acidobacteria bacterium]|nr:MAG: cytochrome c [Acidobacteriota bacterium]REK04286.1 MAG: cytochrome c [Acidobacteriota bacterium]